MGRLLRKVIVRLAAFLLFGLVTLGLLEFGLWLVEPAGVDLVQTQHLPGLSREVRYTLNAFGFRSLSMTSREKDEDVIRVLCIGGSTTDQSTQSTPDTWAALLEVALNERFAHRGVRIEVAAHGRGGERLIHRLNWAARHLFEYDPDVVVTLEGVHDLAFYGGPDYRFQPRRVALAKRGELQLRSALPPNVLSDSLYTHLRSYRAVNDLIWRAVLAREGRLLEWHSKWLPVRRKEYRELPFVAEPVRRPDPIVEFQAAFRAYAELLHGRTQVVVLGQPVIWKPQYTREEEAMLWFFVESNGGRVRPSGYWAQREMRRYDSIQRKVAEEYGFQFVDLGRRIPKTTAYFFDDCHYTDLGSRRIAAVITDPVSKAVEAALVARGL